VKKIVKKSRAHFFEVELPFAQRIWKNQPKKLKTLEKINPLIFYIFVEYFGLKDGSNKNSATIAQQIRRKECFNRIEITGRKVHAFKWVALCYLGYDGREGLKRIKGFVNAELQKLQKGEQQMENEKALREIIQKTIEDQPEVYATCKKQCDYYSEDLSLIAILDAFLRGRSVEEIPGDFNISANEVEKRILVLVDLLGCSGDSNNAEVKKIVEDIQTNWLQYLKVSKGQPGEPLDQVEVKEGVSLEKEPKKDHPLKMSELEHDVWQALFESALEQNNIKGSGAILSGGYSDIFKKMLAGKYAGVGLSQKQITDKFSYMRRSSTVEIIRITSEGEAKKSRGHSYWIADPNGFEVIITPNKETILFKNLTEKKEQTTKTEKEVLKKEEKPKAFTLGDIEKRVEAKQKEVKEEIEKHRALISSLEEELKKVESYRNIAQDLNLA